MSESKPTAVAIGPELLRSVFQEARTSFPRECCGWLAGPHDEDNATVLRPCTNDQDLGGHPTEAGRNSETAYVIEITGNGDKLDAFIKAVSEEKILEVVRSGTSGIARGDKILKV